MYLSTALIATLACTHALEIRAATKINNGFNGTVYDADAMDSSIAEFHEVSYGTRDAQESSNDLSFGGKELSKKILDLHAEDFKQLYRNEFA